MWLQRVPGGGVEGLAYGPNGRMLYTADASGTFTAWNSSTRSGIKLFRIGPGPTRPSVLFTASRGKYLVVQATPPVVWDVQAGDVWSQLPVTWVTPLDIRTVPGSDAVLLYISDSRRSIQTYDTTTRTPGPVHDRWTRTAPLASFDVAPDGRTAALLDKFGLVVLFDLTDARELARFSTQYGTERVRFSPDGNTLAAFQGKQLTLWDVPSRSERVTGLKIQPQPAGFAFHPSRQVFAAVNPDRVMTFWSTVTGEPVRTLDFALGRYAQSVTFTPDGKACAVGGSNKQFVVFDADL